MPESDGNERRSNLAEMTGCLRATEAGRNQYNCFGIAV
jgi:hypothetical protein